MHKFQSDLSVEDERRFVDGQSKLNFDLVILLFLACELGLNERNELIDPRSENVKIKIPIILVDDSMRYLYRATLDRFTDILMENFKLLNYSPLKVCSFFLSFFF